MLKKEFTQNTAIVCLLYILFHNLYTEVLICKMRHLDFFYKI